MDDARGSEGRTNWGNRGSFDLSVPGPSIEMMIGRNLVADAKTAKTAKAANLASQIPLDPVTEGTLNNMDVKTED